MHVSYYQSLDIVLIHMIQFQHLNLTIKNLKKKIHIRIFEGTLCNLKKNGGNPNIWLTHLRIGDAVSDVRLLFGRPEHRYQALGTVTIQSRQ